MSDTDGSPLMRQYRDIKQGYPEAILLFRVGDFYEMFFEDAQEASRLLSIALTSRDKNSANPVPLCGVPYHAASGYIAKLLKAGRTVALCEQVEDPKLAKGLVRREVVQGLLFTAAQDARRLADIRYRGGATSYLEVLDADTRLFNAEIGQADARLSELSGFVELYRALGGGWQP